MPIDLDDAFVYLPSWLAASERKKLYNDLRNMHEGLAYFSNLDFDYQLQGDAYDDAPYVIVGIDAVDVVTTRVVVLSNSCDISAQNERDDPAMVTVAPLVRISKWSTQLAAFGVSVQAIENKITSATAQEISNVFFLPAGAGIEEDSIVLFDQMQSVPMQRFLAANPRRVGILSQAGHWLLLMKLSMHFSRLQDGVLRDAA
ncbi:MAG: hypothetical protein WKF61_02570 [Luteimonas sp.]